MRLGNDMPIAGVGMSLQLPRWCGAKDQRLADGTIQRGIRVVGDPQHFCTRLPGQKGGFNGPRRPAGDAGADDQILRRQSAVRPAEVHRPSGSHRKSPGHLGDGRDLGSGEIHVATPNQVKPFPRMTARDLLNSRPAAGQHPRENVALLADLQQHRQLIIGNAHRECPCQRQAESSLANSDSFSQ